MATALVMMMPTMPLWIPTSSRMRLRSRLNLRLKLRSGGLRFGGPQLELTFGSILAAGGEFWWTSRESTLRQLHLRFAVTSSHMWKRLWLVATSGSTSCSRTHTSVNTATKHSLR